MVEECVGRIMLCHVCGLVKNPSGREMGKNKTSIKKNKKNMSLNAEITNQPDGLIRTDVKDRVLYKKVTLEEHIFQAVKRGENGVNIYLLAK